MANRLNIGIDFFYPNAYSDDRDFDTDMIYVVLLPLITNDRRYGGGDIKKQVRDYFSDGGGGFTPKLVKSSNPSDPDNVEVEEAAFLPFKPNTQILLKRTLGDNYSRTIGGDDLNADWPKIASWNNMRFPKLYYGENWSWSNGQSRLSDKEINMLVEWAIQLLGDFYRGEIDIKGPLKNYLDADSDPNDPKPQFKSLFDKHMRNRNVDSPKEDEEQVVRNLWMKEILLKGGTSKPNILHLYQKVVSFNANGENYDIPIFLYQNSDLNKEELKQIIFDQNNNSYGEIYWNLFSKKVNASTDQELDQVIQSMTMSIFQGERLKWNGNPDMVEDMELPKTPSEEDEPWYWTNIQSKLGLVFGIKLNEAKDHDFFRLEIDGKNIGFPRDEWESFVQQCTLVANYSDQYTYKLLVDTPITAKGSPGRIRFKPKMTIYDKFEEVPVNINVLSVPTTILDALEGKSEYEMPVVEFENTNSKLIIKTPQRVSVDFSLEDSDLLDVKEQIEVVKEAGALMVPAKVTEVTFSGQDKGNHGTLFRIAYDAEQSLKEQSELTYIKRRFGSPEGARIWFTKVKDDGKETFEFIVSKIFRQGQLSFQLLLKETDSNQAKEFIQWFNELSEEEQISSKTGKVNIVFEKEDARGIERFNILIGKSENHLLTLSKYYEFNFYNSTEHLYRRFKIGYGLPKDSRINDLNFDFQNFKKGWVWLKQGGHEIRINEYDHLLERHTPFVNSSDWEFQHNIPTNISDGLQRDPDVERTYELHHEFSYKPNNQNNDDVDALIDQESDRFRMYYGASKEWFMNIGMDHTYGFRKFSGEVDKRAIPITSKVSHPADQVVAIPDAESKEESKIPMVQYSIVRPSDNDSKDGIEILRIRFNKAYFKEVAQLSNTDRATKSLLLRRSFYETILDSLFGVNGPADNKLTLIMERWNFSNKTSERTSTKEKSDKEFPSIVDAMKYQDTWKLEMNNPVSISDPRAKWSDQLGSLLTEDFAKLDENLENLLDDPSFDQRFTFDFPLTSLLDWKIENRETGEVRPIDNSDINMYKRTNLVRVGLKIDRQESRTPGDLEPKTDDVYPVLFEQNQEKLVKGLPGIFQVTSEVWDLTNHPTGYNKNHQVIGLDGNVYRSQINNNKFPASPLYTMSNGGVAPWRVDNFNLHDSGGKMDKIRENALAAVKKVLQRNSDIRVHFEWFQSHPRESVNIQQHDKFDPERIKKLLGPVASKSYIPLGIKENGSETTMYHVPLAFAPLPTHPQLNDQKSTNEYFEFLVQCIQELAAGQEPTLIKLDKPESIAAESLVQLKEKAQELRSYLSSILTLKYLTIVEDDEDLPGHSAELRRWKGYEGRDSEEDVKHQNELLDKVRSLRDKVFSLTGENTVRQDIKELLQLDLSNYLKNKGYGLNIINPDNTSDSLYSVLISKLVYHEPFYRLSDFATTSSQKSDALLKSIVSDLKKSTNSAARKLYEELRKYDIDVNGQQLQAFNAVIENEDLTHKYFITNEFNFLDAYLLELVRIENILSKPFINSSNWAPIKARLKFRKNKLIIDGILRGVGLSADKVNNIREFTKLDSDRFNFINFKLHEGIQYFIDQLDDKTYDSEYEILPSLTLGRTAEDVLEQINQFESNPIDRSIEVRVQPHNPEWREWTSTQGGNRFSDNNKPRRWYNILPSRMAPTAPVFIRQDFVADQHENVEMNLSDKSHLFPVLIEEDPKSTIEKNAKKWFGLSRYGYNDDSRVRLEIDGVPLLQVDDGEPADLLANPNGDPYKQFDRWQCLESYLSHYHFVIEPDEEEGDKPDLSGFQNDTFRIDIDEMPLNYQVSRTDIPKEASLNTNLFEWFKYNKAQMAQTGELDEEIKEPNKLSVDELLATPNEGGLGFVKDLVPEPGFRRDDTNQKIRMALVDRKLKILEDSDDDNKSFGKIVDAHIMTYDKDGARKYVLRLSLLCSAWFKYGVRIRVDRNTRDVDHDGDSDMNPKFRMISEYSPWAYNGSYQVIRSSRSGTLPPKIVNLMRDDSLASNSITRKEWYDLDVNDSTSKSFGNPLKRMIEKNQMFWQFGIENERYPEHEIVAAHKNYQPYKSPMSPNNNGRLVDRDHFVVRSIGKAEGGLRKENKEENIDEQLIAANYQNLFNMKKIELPTVSIGSSITWNFRSIRPGEAKNQDEDEKFIKYKVMTIENWEFKWQ